MIKIKNKKTVFGVIFILTFVFAGFLQDVSLAEASCPTVREGLPGDIMVFAQSIVPCGRRCDVPTTPLNETSACTLCHLIVMVHNIYNLMVAMLITVSLFFVTMGGVLYLVSGGNPSLRSTAKGVIFKTLIGFALFLLTWLIVYTLLVVISADENQLGIVRSGGQWYEFSCDTSSNFGNEVLTGGIGGYGTISTEEQLIRDQVRALGVDVWESSVGATELTGLRSETLGVATDLAQHTRVTITGGSEAYPHNAGTYSHANGYKIDIEDYPETNAYIEGNYTYIGNRSGDGAPVYTDGSGNYYARESTHWDISVGTPAPNIN